MRKQAKAEEKTYTMSDGRGLMLEIRPNGSKLWIVRYWVGGKEKRTSLGKYPDVGLREARDKNIDLRRSLATGKPIGADTETFAAVADEWMEKRMNTKAESYRRVLRLRLDRLIYPSVGHMRLPDITSGVILQLCRRIEDRGVIETAARVKQTIGQVFNYAIATDRAETNPTLALRGALQTRKEKHYSALTEPDKIALLIRNIEGYPYTVIRCALRFSALVFCRPGEIRHGEWAEVDFEKAEWRIPSEKMKMKRPHIVPLARQAVDVLTELKTVTGNQKWLFPSVRNDGRCMSENAIRVALRSMSTGTRTWRRTGSGRWPARF
jgi:integrase